VVSTTGTGMWWVHQKQGCGEDNRNRSVVSTPGTGLCWQQTQACGEHTRNRAVVRTTDIGVWWAHHEQDCGENYKKKVLFFI
jgi:hypothetical protein